MNSYQDAIDTFLYSSFPFVAPAKPQDRFEAVSAAVFGTKQRRNGPMPPPETQVAVRQVIAQAVSCGKPLAFFVPWGASKYDPADALDVAELSSLKQLRCLKDELERYMIYATFTFRVDDLTDVILFGDGARERVGEYVVNFTKLAGLVLGSGADVRTESECASLCTFKAAADRLAPLFLRYLKFKHNPPAVFTAAYEEAAAGALDVLKGEGWSGDIPPEQIRYYLDAYAGLGVPEAERLPKLAQYFAVTLTRNKQGATRRPFGPQIDASFNNPIPGVVRDKPRVHYRSIPERYTHQHRAPWNARGYLRIADVGTVTPRLLGREDDPATVVPNPVEWNGVRLRLDYQLV